MAVSGSWVPKQIKNLNFFSEECSNKGGTNGGSCASGFGVCCTCELHFTETTEECIFINAFFN